ncbi:MAG: acetoacetate--CoA ligase [Chromatiales bacterium]|jgi:acetoacetyl-CoA synthetase|nr:acetoacetate--CoA ligase [Chromatiales bacterium]MDP7092850.1 acetoacetate--CoA ligase [Gammaproteobacteria bacterium]MDP7270508.1 acetoacetate--CoA ligase [Gammaproteobacteria bacterium]HJP05748.1 acetoacetate--CoA ligase [Gammaproteobacteria bacterium]
MTKVVWQSDPAQIAATNLARFGKAAPVRTDNYDALYRWSIGSPEEFWAHVADFTELKFSKSADRILADGQLMPGARWFEGAKLNFAENILRGDDDRAAIIFHDERGRRTEYSRADLRRRSAELAAGLRRLGVKPGDRVAAVLPNCPEAVIAALASASIGAVFTSCSPDFGEQAILERFGQTRPKVLFICDGYSYGGKRIDCQDRLLAIGQQLESVNKIVIVPFLDEQPNTGGHAGVILLADTLEPGVLPDYRQLSFDHPLYILYSSGTTGKPKCIVHGAGGTLLQHTKEQVLHTNLSAGDTIFYFTTCGWMMWNWLVSALGTGATIVLYDGSPMFPDPLSLWRMASEESINVFGTSPKFLTEVEKSGVQISEVGKFNLLRTILSTGAPLAESGYSFVNRQFGDKVQLSSISGGTDIISCFALGNPILPVHRGELQCLGLGMAVEVFDEEGHPVSEQTGELVCTKPFPSMPIGFWDDPDGSAYHATYFERFPGVWAHGDLAERTSNNGLVIHGRSDAVLNPGGVRIGTAEICGPAQTLDEVADSIAIAQRWQGDVRIVLFVVLTEGFSLDDDLEQRIRDVIRSSSSPRHVPACVLSVPEIPRTLSGKAVELAVRAIVHGDPVGNMQAIANPGALEHFRDRSELR